MSVKIHVVLEFHDLTLENIIYIFNIYIFKYQTILRRVGLIPTSPNNKILLYSKSTKTVINLEEKPCPKDVFPDSYLSVFLLYFCPGPC